MKLLYWLGAGTWLALAIVKAVGDILWPFVLGGLIMYILIWS